ncbi:isochorismatase family cysteine hydrolase [Rhodovulum sp. DZ06]|uniref:isochorismatase family cysteine hydrolase n=1 Tax=Rhodovulum sp. DZ06 TaxID=3425126 RepID=UPI003D3302BE
MCNDPHSHPVPAIIDNSDLQAEHAAHARLSRRSVLSGAVAAAGAAAGAALAGQARAAVGDDLAKYAEPSEPALPPSTMALEKGRAALLVVDPQIDFLSPEGVAWGVVGESVTEHDVVANLARLFAAAKRADMPVIISPHYYYPHDHAWKFEGALEKAMHSIGMFDTPGPLSTDAIPGSGADFMPEYRDYIFDGKTIITSPHKVYGPEQNDATLQLRKLKVDQVILAGMSANLCVESHMREFLEQGFEVAVVKDATAGAKVPEGDGYHAALINFRMMANAVWTSAEAVTRMGALAAG